VVAYRYPRNERDGEEGNGLDVEEKKASNREAVALAVVRLVESAVEDRVLVLGSLPPGGRDLELIVRPVEQRAISELLTAEGFARRGLEWAWFFDSTAYAAELIPAERLSLPDGELAALFAEAKILDFEADLRHLVRPTPHHLLLLQARRLVRDGRLHPKRRARISHALDEEPQAWAEAKARAGSWGLIRALGLLEAVYRTGEPVRARPRARALLELATFTAGAARKVQLVRGPLLNKLPRKNRIVGISGLDGAGKSFQAQALRDTLELLVTPAVVEWTPLAQNRTVDVLRSVNRRLLRPFDRRTQPLVLEPPLTYDDFPAGPAHRLRERSAWVTHAWALLVVFANVWFHRRPTLHYPWGGKIAIYDRFVSDSRVRLEFWYGRNRDLRFEKWLLGALSPKPLCSFFLDVPPEVALIRKGEFALSELRRQHAVYRAEAKKLGSTRIDGEAPAPRISAEIARMVWTSLPPHTGE
jgi:thymidylate kinase